jgi:hypothetical protein
MISYYMDSSVHIEGTNLNEEMSNSESTLNTIHIIDYTKYQQLEISNSNQRES